MAENDPNDFLRDSNDNAYVKEQVRTGPPLEYVAEKLRNALDAMHWLLHDLRQQKLSDRLIFQGAAAFRSQLIGYLALKNMLALVNDDNFFDRVEGYSHQQFIDWLDRIDQQGSVT